MMKANLKSYNSVKENMNPEQEEANFKYREFFGRGENKYAVYPDNWKPTWGPIPLLGIVHADNEFLAERLAHDKGISPSPANCTFKLVFKKLEARPSKTLDKTSKYKG